MERQLLKADHPTINYNSQVERQRLNADHPTIHYNSQVERQRLRQRLKADHPTIHYNSQVERQRLRQRLKAYTRFGDRRGANRRPNTRCSPETDRVTLPNENAVSL